MLTIKSLSNKLGSFLLFCLLCFSCTDAEDKADKGGVLRFERSDAVILKGVYVPNSADMFYTSGLVAPIKQEAVDSGSALQYGGTYEQSMGALNRVKETLALKQFALEDVVQLRVYLAPDSSGVIDFKSFFAAYNDFFDQYPDVPQLARATIGVHSLARPGLFVEIEAIAAR